MSRNRSSRKATWMEISVKHAGFRGAGAALKWAYSWGIAREALGHEPSVEEVARWWRMPRRTAFRAQATFREAFPTLETPSPLCDAVEARSVLHKRTASFSRTGKEWDGGLVPSDSEVLWLGQLNSSLPLDQTT